MIRITCSRRSNRYPATIPKTFKVSSAHLKFPNIAKRMDALQNGLFRLAQWRYIIAINRSQKCEQRTLWPPSRCVWYSIEHNSSYAHRLRIRTKHNTLHVPFSDRFTWHSTIPCCTKTITASSIVDTHQRKEYKGLATFNTLCSLLRGRMPHRRANISILACASRPNWEHLSFSTIAHTNSFPNVCTQRIIWSLRSRNGMLLRFAASLRLGVHEGAEQTLQV